MEYILIIILQLLGIGFNVMQNIINLGNKFPDYGRKQIISLFAKEEWDSMGVSVLVLGLDLTAHFIFDYYEMAFAEGNTYILTSYAIALILGYAGQRMAYKYLGKAEEKLDKIVTERLN